MKQIEINKIEYLYVSKTLVTTKENYQRAIKQDREIKLIIERSKINGLKDFPRF